MRAIIGKFLLGEQYDGSKSLLEQVQTLRSREGLGLGLLGFLASPSPAPEKPKEPWEKMPEDYAGGLEEWAKLSQSEKRAIHEALRAGRKIYVSAWQFPEKRATLDGPISTELKLKKLLGS